jgi:hypothetical protein
MGYLVTRQIAKLASSVAIAVLASGLLVPPIARATTPVTVFSNYNGTNCDCGTGGDLYAAGFTSPGNYDFTGAAAFVMNNGAAAAPFSIGLYSSTASGAPGSSLWSGGALSAPGATLVTADYTGSPPIFLRKGGEYFLTLDLPIGLVWGGGGPNNTPFYASSNGGSSWINLVELFGPADPAFEIYGSPVAGAIPEPSTWAMMLFGFAGLGYAGYRTSRKGEAAEAA